MPLLQRVLTRVSPPKQPQPRFLRPLLGLMLRRPGPATCRPLRRYRTDPERTVARWSARDVDGVSLTPAAIPAAVPAEQAPAVVRHASVGPTRGQQTSGLAHVWHGSHSRRDQGVEISTWAWLEITGPGADCLSVEHPPPRARRAPQRRPGWMALWSHGAGSSPRLGWPPGAPWSPRAMTANRPASVVSGPAGSSRGASCEPRPLGALSTRDRRGQLPDVPRPTMARCTGATARGLQQLRPQPPLSGSPTRASTMGRARATSVSGSWWTPHATGAPSSCALMWRSTRPRARAMTKRAAHSSFGVATPSHGPA